MKQDEPQAFIATGIPGCESILCDELRELGFQSVRLNRGAIPFRGDWREGWRACIQSRIAQRIQVVVAQFETDGPDSLYAGVRKVDWTRLLTPQLTLAVRAVCRSSAFKHSGFAALKVKDAVVDSIREASGERPSVSRDDPDVRIYLYVVNKRATLYLDLGGGSLHRRGYRLAAGEAPLKETLAASMLRLAEWDRQSLLMDPMCGSGTIAIEAAQWAKNIPPGLERGRFGFERWANFDDECASELRQLCGECRRDIGGTRPRIIAADHDPAVLEIARNNARAAGVKLAFREQDVMQLQGDGRTGTIVTNPPYGVRLEAGEPFARQLAAGFRKLHGWRVCVLTPDVVFAEAMSMKPTRVVPLANGDIDCSFLIYDVP